PGQLLPASAAPRERHSYRRLASAPAGRYRVGTAALGMDPSRLLHSGRAGAWHGSGGIAPAAAGDDRDRVQHLCPVPSGVQASADSTAAYTANRGRSPQPAAAAADSAGFDGADSPLCRHRLDRSFHRRTRAGSGVDSAAAAGGDGRRDLPRLAARLLLCNQLQPSDPEPGYARLSLLLPGPGQRLLVALGQLDRKSVV